MSDAVPPGVRSALRAQLDAWNDGDLDGFADHLTTNTLYLRAEGPIDGRETLRAHYRAHQAQGSMGTLRAQIQRAERSGGLVVTVVAWSLDGGRRGEGHALLVWREVGAAWQLAYDATLRR
jgi:ketosteroid isomerase-like protein